MRNRDARPRTDHLPLTLIQIPFDLRLMPHPSNCDPAYPASLPTHLRIQHSQVHRTCAPAHLSVNPLPGAAVAVNDSCSVYSASCSACYREIDTAGCISVICIAVPDDYSTCRQWALSVRSLGHVSISPVHDSTFMIIKSPGNHAPTYVLDALQYALAEFFLEILFATCLNYLALNQSTFSLFKHHRPPIPFCHPVGRDDGAWPHRHGHLVLRIASPPLP